MIPAIVHQTWKTDEIPERFRGYCSTWRDLNPRWEYRLWTDRDLLEFVDCFYPQYLELYCRYEKGVQRADAGRYFLLHHFGGFYADIDAECRQSLEPLERENRVIICHEPEAHWAPTAPPRGHPFLLFNGVMASPSGHPFWLHLLSRMRDVSDARDVLDSTGPCLLTGSVLSYPDRDSIRIEGPAFFNPVDYRGENAFRNDPAECYAIHHWAGTWWRTSDPWSSLRRQWQSVLKRYYRLRNRLTGGKRLDPVEARARVKAGLSEAPGPGGDKVAILIPVCDGLQHVSSLIAAISRLDHPRERLKLVFCESDGDDAAFELLKRLTEDLKTDYREIRVLRKEEGSRQGRLNSPFTTELRSRLTRRAMVRNYLIDEGLDSSDDWALWIAAEVWKFPPDIISTLASAGARIVVPNCVREPGGKSVETGSFSTKEVRRDYRYHQAIKGGLYLPPHDSTARLRLSEVRHSDAVPLDSVGGSMLLVEASLHRSGLRFPELPYDDLIDTEGFGRLARDCGVGPIGLPRVEVLRVPW